MVTQRFPLLPNEVQLQPKNSAMLPITGVPIIIRIVAAFVADIHWVVITTSADSDFINTAGGAENWASPLKALPTNMSPPCSYQI